MVQDAGALKIETVQIISGDQTDAIKRYYHGDRAHVTQVSVGDFVPWIFVASSWCDRNAHAHFMG